MTINIPNFQDLEYACFGFGNLCQLVQEGEPTPSSRASHSLNVVSGMLVLFGGGCEGGRSHVNVNYFLYFFLHIVH